MIERFIAEYSERGYRFAYHLCGNAEDAKELVQEAFVRLLKHGDRYDDGQPFEKWFLTVLKNLYFDGMARYERRHGVSLDAPAGGPGDPEARTLAETVADARDEGLLDRLLREEAREEVRSAMAALSPDHRAVLALCDIEGLGYETIASVLDCPLGTVRSRLNRAREALKRIILERSEVTGR